MYYYILPTNMDLQHHGILGMKWGVRRYQNKDGSLTKKGRERYGINNESGVVRNKHKRINTNEKGISKREQFTDTVNLREVNKLYKDHDNCSLCTFAFDLRNRGIDVRAGGLPGWDDGQTYDSIENWYKSDKNGNHRTFSYNKNYPEGIYYGEKVSKMPDFSNFKKDVLSQGEGTSGHMTFDNIWKDPEHMPPYINSQYLGSHDVFYKVENGEIYIYDAQIGKKQKLDDYIQRVDASDNLIQMWPTAFLRTDDLEPEENPKAYSTETSLIRPNKKGKTKIINTAEKTNTPKYNYSPPTLSVEINRHSPMDYNPPYKSKPEMDKFTYRAKEKINDISKKVKNVAIRTGEVASDIGEFSLAILKVAAWGLFPH